MAFLGSTILARHKKYRCVGKNTDECWICQEEFPDRISMLKHLDNHMKVAMQTKDENTGNDAVPANHQQQITAVKNQTVPENSYKCEDCGSLLSHHRLLHICKKDNRGMPCGKREWIHNRRQSQLKALGKQICTLCGRQFPNRDVLEKHTNNIHWRSKETCHIRGSGGGEGNEVLSNHEHSQVNSKRRQ